MGHKSVNLQDPDMRSQIVNTRVSFDGRLKLTKGWRQCCNKNKISFGDKLVFEFVKPNVIQFHIFRGKNVILQGPNKV